MRIQSATIYELNIPFREAFAHSTKTRASSDAIVVKVVSEDGYVGFGEGLPRPYVSGETVDFSIQHVSEVLWPKVHDTTYEPISNIDNIGQFDASLGDAVAPGVIAPTASRSMLEVALIDCALRRQGLSLGDIFKPVRNHVEYAGVIPANSPEKAARHAQKMTMIGLKNLKIKIATGDDIARIKSVVDVIGADTPIRLDANGAWSLQEALSQVEALEQFNVEAIEAPIERTTVRALKTYRNATRMPVCTDEYLVTLEDAQSLIRHDACDIFNVRVSKLGGIWRTWTIANWGLSAGLNLQFGAQVGETAILSAVGRHLIAALPTVLFSEGSAGTLLLEQDISEENIAFGFNGEAPLLTGPGLGITVLEDRLLKFARRTIVLD